MGNRLIVSWDKMKKELKRKYLSNNYSQDIFLTSQHLKQKEARGGVSIFGICNKNYKETTTSIQFWNLEFEQKLCFEEFLARIQFWNL